MKEQYRWIFKVSYLSPGLSQLMLIKNSSHRSEILHWSRNINFWPKYIYSGILYTIPGEMWSSVNSEQETSLCLTQLFYFCYGVIPNGQLMICRMTYPSKNCIFRMTLIFKNSSNFVIWFSFQIGMTNIKLCSNWQSQYAILCFPDLFADSLRLSC